jgi:hypothetical protein
LVTSATLARQFVKEADMRLNVRSRMVLGFLVLVGFAGWAGRGRAGETRQPEMASGDIQSISGQLVVLDIGQVTVDDSTVVIVDGHAVTAAALAVGQNVTVIVEGSLARRIEVNPPGHERHGAAAPVKKRESR